MRSSLLLLAVGLALGPAPPAPAVAATEDGYRHGRVRYVEPGVTMHRATEVGAEEALANVPFLPGDRIWTDAYGRAEFQFPGGALVRVASASKLDYAGHEEGQGERIVLRLWSGSVIVRLRSPQAAQFEVETPGGSVALLDQAMVRVDFDSGEMRVSVYRGEAVVDGGGERVRLSAGERTVSRWGGEAAAPEAFDIEPEDGFARWDDEREAEERLAARSSEYLPAELDPYAGELERNGSWRFEASAGYVWAPRVAASWSPYTSGHWSWTPYGWTWVPYESWGWAPSHYGRWGFSASFGWYWSPGHAWGPAWVSWGVGSGYVGWCPLGYRDRPVYPWHGSFNRGYAVPRGGRAPRGGWNVVREGDFGRHDVARSRVALAGIDPRALRIAESPSYRPSRDARALLASNQPVRAISRRPTPGDFVRELAVDNKTTIPSPWLREGQWRDGVEREPRDARDRAASRRRAAEPGGAGRSEAEASAPTAAVPPESSRARSRGGSRPVPWYAPTEESASTGATSDSTSDRGARRREAGSSRRIDDSGQRETQSSRRDEGYGRRDTQAYRRAEPRPRESTKAAQSLGGFQPREPEARSRRSPSERSEPRSESGAYQRYRSNEPRGDHRSETPRAERSQAPARDDSRAERAAPRSPGFGSSRSYEPSSRPSRSDSGSRPRGGGGAMRSRPPRNHD